MIHTFVELLDGMVVNPQQSVCSLDPLTQRDYEQVRSWNAPIPKKVDACVHDLVLQHAKDCPQSPAVCSWDGKLTYAELGEASLRLAHRLVALGVAPEVLVPVCFTKSMYAIVAMLAILRAGGAFVPLDPLHPIERLQFIVRRANAKILLTSSSTAHLFESLAISTLSVEQILLESLATPVDPLPYLIRPYYPAFVLFTSGSTGNPKGVIQEHGPVCTSSVAHGREMYINSESRVLQYAAYTFDVSMMDIFTTLIHGGCVCTPSEEDRLSNIDGVMNSMHVNWALFTPSVASLITPEEVPGLQTLALGGEAVTKENIQCWGGKVRLLNCYGPAECAASTLHLLEPHNSRPGTIGRAFGCGLCWVVDQANHDGLMPIGAIGELVVEGPTLARGYLDDMEKTKAAFIKSPRWPYETTPPPPRRLYKTGDLVRFNSDGTLEFVGRKDLQLKVRGQRVELGEIEHHLSTYPAIALSIAASPQSGSYSKSLLAVVQLREKATLLESATTEIRLLSKSESDAANFNAADLAVFMKSKLPPYMIPDHCLVVKKLPLSVSGKINRKLVDHWLISVTRDLEALTANTGIQSDVIPEDQTTALEISAKVAALVAPQDHRFYSQLQGHDFPLSAVGLDSVQVISLRMFIKRNYDVRVPIGALLHPEATIRNVARRIEKLRITGDEQEIGTVVNVMEEFQRYQEELFNDFSTKGAFIRNVLVTGATGFLGSQIIFKLFTRVNIRKVIVHVRADSAEHGLRRIIKAATLARWWSDCYLPKLEVWTGDLGRPRIGLNAEQWNRLTGNAPPSQRVHAVIHNGAAVHWNAEFSTLKATNVESTLALLKVVNEASSILKFVYVSGGRHHTFEELEVEGAAKEIALPTAYAQTKYLSELLIKEFSRVSVHNMHRVSIVRPSYIIGTVQHGIANIGDYIWRLAASCIEVKGYNAADGNSWLFLSDVGHVATIITECCDTVTKCNNDSRSSRSSCTNSTIDILDGLPVQDFWAILSDLGYDLAPMHQDAWMDAVQTDIDVRHESHPLWPLLHTFETDHGRLGVPTTQIWQDSRATAGTARVKAAIRRNVEFMCEVGFLPRPNKRKCITDEELGDAVFRRSGPAGKQDGRRFFPPRTLQDMKGNGMVGDATDGMVRAQGYDECGAMTGVELSRTVEIGVTR